MRISTYQPAALVEADGIEVASADLGAGMRPQVGAAWIRLRPGAQSQAHQHDESETWLILAGDGELTVNAETHAVSARSLLQFEPFETHSVRNTGDSDLVLVSLYWRDGQRALRAARGSGHRRLDRRPVFVFSSAPTPNGDLHLGHLSGPFFGADVFVRYQRMRGVDAWYLTGSDDFQSYVVAAARREGGTPAELAAHYSAKIRETLRLMDIEPDQYTVTSADEAYPAALRAFFTRLTASPAMTAVSGPALFDAETGRYLFEADVSGGCPTCGNPTGGNICEGCREPNVCADLVEPRSAFSDAAPRLGSATRYTVALHELADEVAEHHRFGRVPPEVKELTARVFRRERIDIPVTHEAQWGVRPDESDVDGQVIWSWLDYAFSILFSIEELGRRAGRPWTAAAPEADWKIVHFLGADGTFFHPIMIPALYRMAFPDWAPDIDYHVNEFYLLDGEKFSTSRRHAIWGKDILNPGTVDAVRLYLAATRPEGRRTNFSREDFQRFTDDTLVGGWQAWLRDLGSRIEEQYGGHAPDAGVWRPEHTAFLSRLDGRLTALTDALGQDGFSLNAAAEQLRGIVEDAIAFGRRQAPVAGLGNWRDEARTAVALELAAARLLATCAEPVMPRFAAALRAALGLPETPEWPETVELVPAGNRVELAGRTFFGAEAAAKTSPTLLWLSDLVRGTLRLGADDPVADRSLVALGMESLQAIALQYQIVEQVGADITIADLMSSRDVAELAARIAGDIVTEPAAALPEVRG